MDITGQVGRLKILEVNAGVVVGLRYLHKIMFYNMDYLYMSAESQFFSGIVYKPETQTIYAIIDYSINSISRLKLVTSDI